jgi:polyisoprenoid-binding protein YceI
MSRLKLIVLATILAASPACKKKQPAATEGSGQTSGSSMAGSSAAGSSMAGSSAAGSDTGSAAGSGSSAEAGSAATDPAPTATADFISVFGEHKDKKPDDPVEVHFEKFAVTKATFDPTKIEGGSATIEIDATSVKSGKGGRDKHLSEGYLNVAKFAKLVINIDNVKQKDGKVYSADAKVKAVGVEKKYPVTFEVVDGKDDWIKIKGEHKFSRLDFKIGKDPKDKDESVAPDLTIKMLLTLKKT